MFGYWREAPPHTPTPPVHIGDSLDPHHQLSNLTKSPNSNSSKFPPKSRSRFSSYEQGVASPQNPRSTTPSLDITGHILFFMTNITGWISMSIEKITGRRFFSIERITGNFGSSLMNCSRQPVRYAVRKTKIAVLRFLFYSLHISSLV